MRVSVGEAARVYAPLTLMPEAEDVAELAAAIREVLGLPDYTPGSTEAYTAHRELLATRAYYVKGALAPLAEREANARNAIASLRRADEWYPVTYPTADDQDAEDGLDGEALAAYRALIGERVSVSLKDRGDSVTEVRGILTAATRAGLWIGDEDGEHILLGDVAGVEAAPDSDREDDPGNGADFFACEHKTTDEPGHHPSVCRRLTDAEMDALMHGAAKQDGGDGRG
ncbi:hypothetical protein GCM10022254_09070 [Actinomadura meridiana]|uniref:Uncharacterized protein n=1 Tax=Actinomadura meridiana TaxID=559626 RepID=A0ABP8BTN6_9ACTN